MKIALFGGSFNPPHLGHRAILQKAINQLQLDKVIVMPCCDCYYKSSNLDGKHRLAMARLAFGDLPVEISSYEVDKGGYSYTVDTVNYLRELYSNSTITLIIGGDSYKSFSTWHNYEQLVKLVDLAVVGRDEIIDLSEYDYPCKKQLIESPLYDISSTDIRLRQQFNLDITQCVSSEVWQYILHNNLYSSYHWYTEKLRTMIDEKRYSHSYFTTRKGLELSGGKDTDRVFLACALHDCAKCLGRAKYLEMGVDCSIPTVAHAYAGAQVAKSQFGINDEEILDSIYYHTTGKADMSLLGKIVYLADKLEDSRPYPTAHLIGSTLDETLHNTIVEVIESLHERGIEVDCLTKQAEMYYNQQTKEKL